MCRLDTEIQNKAMILVIRGGLTFSEDALSMPDQTQRFKVDLIIFKSL
jgi:hypothetical protein